MTMANRGVWCPYLQATSAYFKEPAISLQTKLVATRAIAPIYSCPNLPLTYVGMLRRELEKEEGGDAKDKKNFTSCV